jgi:hypothetical protein
MLYEGNYLLRGWINNKDGYRKTSMSWKSNTTIKLFIYLFVDADKSWRIFQLQASKHYKLKSLLCGTVDSCSALLLVSWDMVVEAIVPRLLHFPNPYRELWHSLRILWLKSKWIKRQWWPERRCGDVGSLMLFYAIWCRNQHFYIFSIAESRSRKQCPRVFLWQFITKFQVGDKVLRIRQVKRGKMEPNFDESPLLVLAALNKAVTNLPRRAVSSWDGRLTACTSVDMWSVRPICSDIPFYFNLHYYFLSIPLPFFRVANFFFLSMIVSTYGWCPNV